jgi:hypothetical protein
VSVELDGICHCGDIDLVLHWTGDPLAIADVRVVEGADATPRDAGS